MLRVLVRGIFYGLWSFLLATAGSAGVPEPPAVLYGEVELDGVPQTGGVLVEFKSGSDVLASYSLGSVAEAGGLYFLQLNLETDVPANPIGAGVNPIGQAGLIYLTPDGGDAIPAKYVVLQGRGRVSRLDLSASSASPISDVDLDGIPDFGDNCGARANPDQLDANGNGIGALCDGEETPLDPDDVVNPAPAFQFVGDVDPDGSMSDTSGYGSTAYSFRMGATEVTNAAYAEFLNSVAAADPSGLFSANMESDSRGGIVRIGSPGGFSYQLKPNAANKPVNFVSWLDAARYANWLDNGMPVGAQGAATTEDGAFDLSVASPATDAIAKNLGEAEWSLPTEDEWYKAAYFDPAAQSYSLYPTASNSDPTPALATSLCDVSNPGSNVANVESAADCFGLDGMVTSVGSAQSASFFGTLDQGGNVREWLAADSEAGSRIARGGAFSESRTSAQSGARALEDPLVEVPEVGFRVVQIANIPGDADQDGILADGDGSQIEGDSSCAGGATDACDDNCPKIANADQADLDADGVGDLCDNCVKVFNPRLGDPNFPAIAPPIAPFQDASGNQLDDDLDGFGNHCDAKFGTTGQFVGGVDLTEIRASFNKDRAGNDCGTTHDKNCAQFDLNNAGQFIGGGDVTRARQLFNQPPGPKCAACPVPNLP